MERSRGTLRPGLRALAALLLLSVAGGRASAQERFVLKDERAIDGKVVGESDTTVIVRTAGGIVTIEKKELLRREKVPAAGAAGAGAGGAPAAAVELRRMPNPGVHDAKVDALVAGRKKESSPLPKETRGYLGGLEPDRALDIVMTIYHEAAGTKYLRSSAVHHLRYCRGAKMLPVAYETVAADGDPYVRGRAVFGLAEFAAGQPEGSEFRRKGGAIVRKSLSSKSSWEPSATVR